jgi:hypothetical protein
MQLELRADSTIRLKHRDTLVKFTITGTVVGEYQVAFAGRANRYLTDDTTILSNYVTIDVFPPLQIIPPEVLLMPGQLYTLDYDGGPNRAKYKYYSIELKWSMAETSVALIDQKALVNAQETGTSRVHLEMFRKGAFLIDAWGKVVVDYATSVQILGMANGRTVLTESATRLIAQLYVKNEPLVDAVSDTRYYWTSNSPNKYEIWNQESVEG